MAATALGVPQIDAKHLHFKARLGAGNFGTVYRATCRGRSVAVKKPVKGAAQEAADSGHMAPILVELYFLKTLSHPHIIKLLGVVNNTTAADGKFNSPTAATVTSSDVPVSPRLITDDVWLVMEYLNRGSLFEVLHDTRGAPSLEIRIAWARELAMAVAALYQHDPHVYHRDLTSTNVMISADGHVRLGDFGLSVDSSCDLERCVLHKFKPAYAAPEVWAGLPYTERSDIYSYGVVLFELATLLDPVTALRQGHGVLPPPAAAPTPAEGPADAPTLPGTAAEAVAAMAATMSREAPHSGKRDSEEIATPPVSPSAVESREGAAQPELTGEAATTAAAAGNTLMDARTETASVAGRSTAATHTTAASLVVPGNAVVAVQPPLTVAGPGVVRLDASASNLTPQRPASPAASIRSLGSSAAARPRSRTMAPIVLSDIDPGVYTDHSVSSAYGTEVASDDDGFLDGRDFQALSLADGVGVARLSNLLIPDSCQYDLRSLILQCWADDPARRPSAQQILALLPIPGRANEAASEGARTMAAAAAAAVATEGEELARKFRFEEGAPVTLAGRAAPATTVVFSHANPNLLAYGSLDGAIVVVRLPTGREDPISQVALEGHTRSVTDFSWAHGDSILLSVSLDKTARVWDTTKGQCLRIIYEKVELFSCRLHPRNNNLFLVGSVNREMKILNMSTGKAQAKLSVGAAVGAAAFNHSGDVLFAGDADGFIYACSCDWQTGEMKQLHKTAVSKGRGVTSLSFTIRYGRKRQVSLLLADIKDDLVHLFGVTDDAKLLPLAIYATRHSNYSLRSVFCPRTRSDMGLQAFASGSEDGSIAIHEIDDQEIRAAFNTPTGQQLAPHGTVYALNHHRAPVVGIAWNCDVTVMVSVDALSDVCVWRKAPATPGLSSWALLNAGAGARTTQ